MNDTPYKGWPNYCSWRVNLDLLEDMEADYLGISESQSNEEVALHLKEWCEECICHLTDESIARDFAIAFMADVDWIEIAKHTKARLFFV
jgi:hypothetical protein